MSGFVYILQSLNSGRYYIGSTDDLIRRFRQHAQGTCHTTKRMLPVVMVAWKTYPALVEARRAEKALKQSKSRTVLENWMRRKADAKVIQ